MINKHHRECHVGHNVEVKCVITPLTTFNYDFSAFYVQNYN